MTKLRALFYIYLKSLYSPAYYLEVLETKFKFSLKYFLLLGVVISTIATIGISIKAVPMAKTGMDKIITTAKQQYPQDLVISSKDNVWSINKPQPYAIAFPAQETQDGEIGDTPKNIIVFFDEGTVDDIDKLDTLILVNKKNILVKDSNSFRVYPLQNIPNGSIDKAAFEKFIDQVKTETAFLPYLIAPFILLGLLIYFLLIRFIYLLIMALPIMLIGQMLNVKMEYINALKFSMHVITGAITIEMLAMLIHVKIPVPMWFTLMFVIESILILTKIRKTGQIDETAATDTKDNS